VIEETENNFYDTSMFGRRQPDFLKRHGDSQQEEEHNVLGMIHPSSEGKSTEDRPSPADQEYITEAGHKFALLDWGLDEPTQP